MKPKSYRLPVSVFILTFILLGFVQLKLRHPIILAERFLKGTGWIEILLISLYGAFVATKMEDRDNVPKWRTITWTVFSVVFFSQLVIGLCGEQRFLMTGKLHLPIPMMIIAGPIYRGQFSVMTVLFLSTVILTGPAWCSQLCYFGAFDNLVAKGKTSKQKFGRKGAIKSTFLFLVILGAIVLRLFRVDILISTFAAISFGIAGILIMFFFSMRRKKMVHCVMYCPVGTLVNLIKPVNPFRMYIDKTAPFACTALHSANMMRSIRRILKTGNRALPVHFAVIV